MERSGRGTLHFHGEARGLELGRELLAWRNGVATGRPKDFRTWHATVLAAAGLADAGPTPHAERAVLELLG